MAVVAKGDWVIVKNVVALISNDESRAPSYSGTVAKLGPEVADVLENDNIYFDQSHALAIHHDASGVDFYIIHGYDIIAVDN